MKDAPQKWRGQTLEILVQAAMSELESFFEKIFFEEDIGLPVHVEGRKPRYFKCCKRGHPGSNCYPLQKENEKENKSEETAPPVMEAIIQRATTEPENLEKKTSQSNTISGRDRVPNGVTKKAKEDNEVTK